jgi:hypothetical protein
MAASEQQDKAKKLAAQIQAASTSETFDLAGYGAASLEQLVASGLKTPIKCPAMLRLTFVVGGGKKVRQKYDEKLSQLFADALKAGGFTEDRGAALALECQGTFKQQHVSGPGYAHMSTRLHADACGCFMRRTLTRTSSTCMSFPGSSCRKPPPLLATQS